MSDPAFHVDPPEGDAAPQEPQNSEVPHADVQAGLADALGVPADELKSIDGPDAVPPPAGGFDSPEAARKAWAQDKEAAAQKAAADVPKYPGWPGEPIPGTPKEPHVILGPEWAKARALDADAQEKASAAQPGATPFATQAQISQRIKRAMDQGATLSNFPEVEIEGFHILAQLVSQIMTSEPAKAREIWMQLGKHCDDVAAALR